MLGPVQGLSEETLHVVPCRPGPFPSGQTIRASGPGAETREPRQVDRGRLEPPLCHRNLD